MALAAPATMLGRAAAAAMPGLLSAETLHVMLAVVVLAVCVDAALRRRTSKAWRGPARDGDAAAEGAALFAEEEGLGRGADDASAAPCAAAAASRRRSRAHSRNAFSPRSYLGRLRKLLGDDEISHRRVGLAVATSAAGLAAARAASRKFEHVPYTDEMTAAGNRVSYYRSANNQRVADALRSLEAYATPTFYNKHLMTGAPILRIDDDDLLFQRHVLSARLDGHLVEVAADTLASPRASLDSPSFIVVPGFGGSSEKNLYRILAKSIAERFNAHVHILHERGEGGVPLRSHKLHKMDTRMLEALIEKVRADRGMQVPLFGLGLSQGGSLLLKYIQGFAAPGSPPCPFAAVMTVGCTFQYQVGLQLMEVNGLVGRCYSYILAKMHIDILRRNKEVLDNLDNVDIGEIATCSNLSDLDRKLANPVYGHHSVVAYHDSFNLVEQAHNINIPVLCLHSEDDPLFSDDTHRIQRAAARCSDRIVFFSVPRGGHLSFCERGTRSTYVTRVADRFFKTLLQQQRPVDGQ